MKSMNEYFPFTVLSDCTAPFQNIGQSKVNRNDCFLLIRFYSLHTSYEPEKRKVFYFMHNAHFDFGVKL